MCDSLAVNYLHSTRSVAPRSRFIKRHSFGGVLFYASAADADDEVSGNEGVPRFVAGSVPGPFPGGDRVTWMKRGDCLPRSARKVQRLLGLCRLVCVCVYYTHGVLNVDEIRIVSMK